MAQKSKAEKAKAARVRARKAKVRKAKEDKKAGEAKAKRLRAEAAKTPKVKSNRKELGINKFEVFMLIITLRNQLKYAFGKDENSVAFRTILIALGGFIEKVGQKADPKWRAAFAEQANALQQLGYLLDNGGIAMKKIELGITGKELFAMLPGLIGEIWPHYNDDQKITVDEGVLIAAAVFDALADPTDDEYAKAFFAAQAGALRAIAPLFEEEEADEE